MFFEELRGFDLGNSLDAGQIKAFKQAMDRCGVGLIRNQEPLTDAQHVDFSRQLGPLLKMKMLLMVGKSASRFAFPEPIDVGNTDAEGRLLPEDDRRRACNRGNLLWHTDGSFDDPRGHYSLLAAHLVPPGGAPTEFAGANWVTPATGCRRSAPSASAS